MNWPTCFATVPDERLHGHLAAYATISPVATRSYYDARARCYVNGRTGERCRGLLKPLRKHFYPHYTHRAANRPGRRRTVSGRASSRTEGITVDHDLLRYVRWHHGMLNPLRVSKPALALVRYWEANGHRPQAAQLPVEIPTTGHKQMMTQADFITADAKGRLWLWEVKTASPFGASMAQGTLRTVNGNVPCNQYNIWHLQLYYTFLGLAAAGIPIKYCCVIQIKPHKSGVYEIIVRKMPKWTRDLLPPAFC